MSRHILLVAVLSSSLAACTAQTIEPTPPSAPPQRVPVEGWIDATAILVE